MYVPLREVPSTTLTSCLDDTLIGCHHNHCPIVRWTRPFACWLLIFLPLLRLYAARVWKRTSHYATQAMLTR